MSNDTKVQTLVEFLTARLDEREDRVKRLAAHPETDMRRVREEFRTTLADIEAKRRIVSMFAPKVGEDIDRDLAAGNDLPWMGREAMRALASVYADHPDYRDEWKP